MARGLAKPGDVFFGITNLVKLSHTLKIRAKARAAGLHAVGFLAYRGNPALALIDAELVAPSDQSRCISKVYIAEERVVLKVVKDMLLSIKELTS